MDRIDCPAVTGGGTGTYEFDAASGVYTEVQPGSYCFMDVDYGANDYDPGTTRYEHSLFILATVMSMPVPERAVVDAGLKAYTLDSGMPTVWQRPGVEFARAADEHGTLAVEPDVGDVRLGDRLLLVPGHCDPTVNLHDWFIGVRGRVVEQVWDVSARGRLV